GVSGVDEEIFDLKPGFLDREKQATREAIATLKAKLETEKDPAVRQDLEILIRSAEDNIKGIDLSLKYEMPYFSVSRTVFQGLRALLDDRIAPERRKAALVRLRKYAGVQAGYTPITELAIARIREHMDPKLLGPVKAEVEKELQNSPTYIDGIG